MDKRFLLVNLKTGLMDGIYKSKDGALQSFEYFKSTGEPGWILTEVLESGDQSLAIPDNLFHRTADVARNS